MRAHARGRPPPNLQCSDCKLTLASPLVSARVSLCARVCECSLRARQSGEACARALDFPVLSGGPELAASASYLSVPAVSARLFL